MAQTSKSTSGMASSSAPEVPKAQTASKETARERYTKLISKDPRFKAAKKSEQGFVIGGVKS
jgi:hypothetical protein